MENWKRYLHPRMRPKTPEEKELIASDEELLQDNPITARIEHLLYNYATQNRAGKYAFSVSAPKDYGDWVNRADAEGAGAATWDGWITNVEKAVKSPEDKKRLEIARQRIKDYFSNVGNQ